jgi:hypothetical protein
MKPSIIKEREILHISGEPKKMVNIMVLINIERKQNEVSKISMDPKRKKHLIKNKDGQLPKNDM